ncbi:uncharacterized protein LACBIDRAFT_332854 [Laccaria bicolor S238N-H82]|uniref:Predicted protein n=1 Tax=Laccaria bicolor (strain S238N-H82 / ATCC MYA-4686) TaxID=486041 RepID=B0DU31_LACBS|nr:uncharacterized protein LACBIDRAFT_332854 [Laccaria bicolor S238N-H82]EDR01832.1 predicted protein [Laccaria bicolor S238N-H82]|eukprot:XP_001887442.1 predicted protein [Laccaria bicolor S238N-H82]
MTFAGMNHVDAHLHDNLGLLSASVCYILFAISPSSSKPEARCGDGRRSTHGSTRLSEFDTTSFNCDSLLSPQRANTTTAQALAGDVTSSDSHTERRIRQSMFRALSTSLSPKPPCLPRGVAQREALALRLQKSALNPITSSNRSNFRLDQWSKSFDKFDVVLKFSRYAGAEPPTSGDLRPTTDELFKLVERFRVLVIGKVALLYLYSQVLAHSSFLQSGVGKSSLINECFGVKDAAVAHSEAGVSNINTPIIASENGRFVLHDSQGFEHGEGDNFKKVVDFLKVRKDMPNVRDQVHAVWLCFPVSLSKGDRLFEAGVEELFRMKSNGDLGPVPVITVFTKYDKLEEQVEYGNNLEFHKRNKHLDRETRNARLAEETAAQFQELCVGPFEKVVGIDIPHIAVSTNKEYKDTRKMLNELVRLTADCVKNTLAVDVAEDVALVSAIAQRVNPAVKIDAGWEEAYESFGVPLGESYWMGLAASVNFPGKTIEECLRVLHTDIVEVWNIQDGCGYLESKELKKLMFELVGNQYDEPSDPNTIFPHAYSLLGALTMLIGGLTAPAAPIVIPIVASLLLAKWIFDVYKQSYVFLTMPCQNAKRKNLRALMLQRLMAYIVDFTIIMQIIFGLVVNARLRLSRRLIKLVFKAYSISDERSKVHKEIKEHVKLAGRFDQDAALAKIIQLIKEYQMKPEIMEELQSAAKAFENNEDEDWGVGKT